MATYPAADLLDAAKLSKILEMHAGGRVKAIQLLKNALNELESAASKKRKEAPEKTQAAAGPPLVPDAVKGGFLGGVPKEEIDDTDTTLVMVIPHEAIKYVIGKGGASLRFVEQNVGLTQKIKIQRDDFADPNSVGRNLTLVGSTKACTLGSYLIMRCLHETCGKTIYPEWCARAWAEANQQPGQPGPMGAGPHSMYRGGPGPAPHARGILPSPRGGGAPGGMPNPRPMQGPGLLSPPRGPGGGPGMNPGMHPGMHRPPNANGPGPMGLPGPRPAPRQRPHAPGAYNSMAAGAGAPIGGGSPGFPSSSASGSLGVSGGSSGPTGHPSSSALGSLATGTSGYPTSNPGGTMTRKAAGYQPPSSSGPPTGYQAGGGYPASGGDGSATGNLRGATPGYQPSSASGSMSSAGGGYSGVYPTAAGVAATVGGGQTNYQAAGSGPSGYQVANASQPGYNFAGAPGQHSSYQPISAATTGTGQTGYQISGSSATTMAPGHTSYPAAGATTAMGAVQAGYQTGGANFQSQAGAPQTYASSQGSMGGGGAAGATNYYGRAPFGR